ncbi:putative Inosine triphosphate pyrophosphatase [Blattamonas nauphoetae]|uniref:Inosine triphosphate pyrophosphatase n=1 Tax=Blattamonas nauphoetae TaxID=2049346 RepID=A0ABQ9XHT4_9EUKA|nr:putative Inosine triphosphate pyrophosphatase [Blattamonas nauphoetae]
MNQKKTIYFCTGNSNKLREVRDMCASTQYDIQQIAIDLPELQGEPGDVVLEKVRLAYEKVKQPVLVEDTCLCFNAMGGLPGVYIKWFLEKLGHEGLNKMLDGFEDRSAYAMCSFGFIDGINPPQSFVGTVAGHIVRPRGGSFGWDPVFEEDESKMTFGEMTPEQKHACSHRSRALKKLLDFLQAQ